MPTEIVITAHDLRLEGVLNDSPTAQALADALPVSGRAQLWGDEIYFPVPQVVAELDDTATPVVQVGDLGYWPSGRAFCIFFGLTPASVPGEIRPASAVNLVGRLYGDPCCLKLVPEGATVRIDKKKKIKSKKELLEKWEKSPGQLLTQDYCEPQSVDDSYVINVPADVPSTSTVIVDQILEQLEWGKISFNVIDEMNLKEVREVELVLSLNKTIEELNKEITAIGNIESADVRVANVMQARLTGQYFSITATTSEEQAVSGQDITKWAWEVSPTKPGLRSLHLTLGARIIAQGAVTTKVIRTFDKNIQINITFRQKTGIFIKENWQWLSAAAGLIGGLFAWLWRQFH